MLFLKNQSIQFLKALRIKQLQDFCFLKYIMGLYNQNSHSEENKSR